MPLDAISYSNERFSIIDFQLWPPTSPVSGTEFRAAHGLETYAFPPVLSPPSWASVDVRFTFDAAHMSFFSLEQRTAADTVKTTPKYRRVRLCEIYCKLFNGERLFPPRLLGKPQNNLFNIFCTDGLYSYARRST